MAAGRARSASGEQGRCTDPSKVRCTNSSRSYLPNPCLAAFGMDYGFGANQDARSSHSCVCARKVVCVSHFFDSPQPENGINTTDSGISPMFDS